MVKTEETTKPLKKKWDETDVFLILGLVLAIGVLGWLGWRIFTSGPDPQTIRYQHFGKRVHVVDWDAPEVLCRVASSDEAAKCRLGDKIVYHLALVDAQDILNFAAEHCRAVHPVLVMPDGLICVKNAGYVSSEERDRKIEESGCDGTK